MPLTFCTVYSTFSFLVSNPKNTKSVRFLQNYPDNLDSPTIFFIFYLSIYLFICLSVSLSVCLSVCMPACLPA